MAKILVLPGVIIVGTASAFFLFWHFFYTPEYAKTYSAALSGCQKSEENCRQINFSFTHSGKAENKIPEYAVQEIFNQGKTKITFNNVNAVNSQLDYNEIADNSLIEDVNYYLEGENLTVEIKRKGAYSPAEIAAKDSLLVVQLKDGDENYPLIFNEKPADNSAAYPIFRKITFEAALKDALKETVVLLQGEPAELSITRTSTNNYRFQFSANIEKDKQYLAKVIVKDVKGRAFVKSWTFQGQIPIEATLGSDRFKYLGWWGQINTNGISVRSGPGTSFEKAGDLSSMNRVKVLKEVAGETINDNNLWYQIDGGFYAGAYVFSEFVTPIIQPEPPEEFTIPDIVKDAEYWIDVNLTKKVLTLFLYDKPVFSTYAAIGRDENPTATGTFRVWHKLKRTRMQGGPPLHEYKYDLPDVPNVLYYEGSLAIHGTYWHDKFGTQQSAGCTNLTQGDAAFIFDKVNPKLKEGEELIFSSAKNPGTVVFNHY